MKILKRIIYVIVIIIAIPLIVALFVPKDYAVEREVIIQKDKTIVFDYLKYLKNQDNYSTWAKMDPDMKKEFEGTDGTVGFISKWDSENEDVGKGEQEIVKIDEGNRIDFELRFLEPFEAEDDAFITTESLEGGSTKVVWGFKGAFPYPMNLMGLFIDMDKELGTALQGGLDELKVILEE